ncbi:hypothetical protein HYT56_03320 [Candidatus Woesearchaeota archaeon]|nr:hypothetical protein [Candidatus Woesearchaeota archaeon]
MVICLITLPILGILAIFSATHRRLFIEALDCVLRKATFRKCRSRLDERLKSQISGRLLDKNQKLGIFVFKNFELISWILIILLILSLIFSAQGIYNYIKHGNCNGVNSEEFCIINFSKNDTSYGSNEENCTEEDNYTVYLGDYSSKEDNNV